MTKKEKKRKISLSFLSSRGWYLFLFYNTSHIELRPHTLMTSFILNNFLKGLTFKYNHVGLTDLGYKF